MEQLDMFSTLSVFIIYAIAPIYYPVTEPPNVVLNTLISTDWITPNIPIPLLPADVMLPINVALLTTKLLPDI